MFKVGDKARCTASKKILTVVELPGHCKHYPLDVRAVYDKCGSYGLFSPNQIELAEDLKNEEHLQSLVKKANEGYQARNELHKLAFARFEVKTNGGEGFFKMADPSIKGYHNEVRLTPLVSQEKKFILQNYEVIITKDLCQVGCKKDFHFRELMLELRQLTREGDRKSGEWEISRTGIYNTSARGALTWENADKLLAELEQFEKD